MSDITRMPPESVETANQMGQRTSLLLPPVILYFDVSCLVAGVPKPWPRSSALLRKKR